MRAKGNKKYNGSIGCSRLLCDCFGFSGKQSHDKEINLFWSIRRNHRQRLQILS